MVELRGDYGLSLRLPIRGFTFTETARGLSLVDTNALGIESLMEATLRIISYIEESIPAYIDRESKRGDQATYVCFKAAMEMSRQSNVCFALVPYGRDSNNHSALRINATCSTYLGSTTSIT
jgi:hypothetical protein